MKRIIALSFFSLSALLLFGCEKKVVTVADIYTADSQEENYIEIKELELKKQEETENQNGAVLHCVVAIPAGYVEAEGVPNMYVHERNPLDSSNVYYSAFPTEGQEFDFQNLTADEYKQMMENAYGAAGDAGDEPRKITVNSFEKTELEGFPSYVIRTSLGEGNTAIEQLVYLITADKIYMIVYSQAADDELLADFEVSEGRIRLVRQER